MQARKCFITPGRLDFIENVIFHLQNLRNFIRIATQNKIPNEDCRYTVLFAIINFFTLRF